MKHRSVFCILFLVLTALSHSVVGAEERHIDPVDIDQQGGIGLPEIVYQYGGNGIQIDLIFVSSFWPQYGTMELSKLGGGSVEQDLLFHQVSGDSSTWFTPLTALGYFSDRYAVGFITAPGVYNIDVFVEDNPETWVFADFGEIEFASFDFDETTCRFGPGLIGIDFSVFALEPLHQVVDTVEVAFSKGAPLVFTDVPFEGGSPTFGWITIPIGERKYDKQLAGKVLQTTFTIDDETVMWWVFYPHTVNVRPTCDRG